MNLYAAIIRCKVRSKKKSTQLHGFDVQDYRCPIAADSEAAAKLLLEQTFPWTFLKHVDVRWETTAENL